jgi:non-ribosomal peptide synthetase component F
VANAAESILAVTTISFDASLHEIAISLFNGLTLVLANEEQTKNPLDMASLINEHHIGYVSATPSQWQTWIYSDEFVEAIRNVPIIRFGGEKLPESLLHQMQKLTPSRILNTYGPTETTVSSNIQELTHAERVTVGRPQLNVREFVVDSDGNELPVGVVGELYIGGRGVARGYNNLDEMTRERFIDYHGTRIYKSGDYAKWAPDGDVFILGRKDHQIKLRGLRIELGEVENVIARVEGVKNVVIKLGAKGCYFKNSDTAIRLPACAVQAVDATGAGDNFVAGFASELLRGSPVGDALRFANACGAICASAVGAGTALKSRDQVLELAAKEQARQA